MIPTIIIVVSAALIVIGVVIAAIVRKAKGKTACCDCSQCPSRKDCSKK